MPQSEWRLVAVLFRDSEQFEECIWIQSGTWEPEETYSDRAVRPRELVAICLQTGGAVAMG